MRTPTAAAFFLLTFVTTPIFGYGIGKRDSINSILRRSSSHHGRAIDDVTPVLPSGSDTTSTTTDSTSQPTSTTSPISNLPLTDPASFLNAHNDVRSRHGANPLVWSDELESYAQEWAGQCVLRTSGGAFGQYGENMVAGSGAFTASSAVYAWADEKGRRPDKPGRNNRHANSLCTSRL